MKGRYPPPSWEFSDWQRPVWNATRNLELPATVLINAGRGAGKDIICVRCGLRDAFKLYRQKLVQKREGKLRAALNPMVQGWLVAPSDHNLAQLKKDFEGHLKELEEEWELRENALYRWVERKSTYYIIGEGQIEFETRLSSTKDALRGPGIDVLIWTEFAAEKREGAWQEEAQGTLSRAGRLGRAYLNSTPKGPSGLWHRLCKPFLGSEQDPERVKDDATGLVEYFHTEALSNEFLTDAQRTRIEAEKSLGWIYDQERRARFVVPTGGENSAFSKESLGKCLVARLERPRYGEISCGVDVAEEGTERTALVLGDPSSRSVICAKMRGVTSGPEIIDEMESIYHGFPGVEFVLDGTGQKYLAGFVEERNQQRGIRMRVRVVHYRDQMKVQRVRALRYWMDVGSLSIPHWDECPWLKEEEKEAFKQMAAELFSYQRRTKASGAVEYGHAAGGTDDMVSGLLLAFDEPLSRQHFGDGQEAMEKVDKVRFGSGGGGRGGFERRQRLVELVRRLESARAQGVVVNWGRLPGWAREWVEKERPDLM